MVLFLQAALKEPSELYQPFVGHHPLHIQVVEHLNFILDSATCVPTNIINLVDFCATNMEISKRTIIVTGANKGIGYGLTEALAKEGNWRIIMGCRNLKLGQESLDKLKALVPGADI